MKLEDLKKFIRDIPDFPKKGIIFKDITPLINNPDALKFAIDTMCAHYRFKNIQKIASVEARGFVFGSIIAYNLGCGFVPVRKKGKLPYKTISVEYQLEYGTEVLEIHKDAIDPGENILIVDDVIATGGTAKAVASLIEYSGGKVGGICCLVELSFLNPREKLQNYEVFSLITY